MLIGSFRHLWFVVLVFFGGRGGWRKGSSYLDGEGGVNSVCDFIRCVRSPRRPAIIYVSTIEHLCDVLEWITNSQRLKWLDCRRVALEVDTYMGNLLEKHRGCWLNRNHLRVKVLKIPFVK